MKIEISGSSYYETVRLIEDGCVIYDGDLIDLITSENGSLELKLNYGTRINHCVVLKKDMVGNILFIPKMNECFKSGYKYKMVFISVEEFINLWKRMGYEPLEDMKLIESITLDDYLLAWAITSNYRGNENRLERYLKNLKDECLAILNDRITVEQMFNMIYSAKIVRTVGKANSFEIISIYLDSVKEREWEALYLLDNELVCLRLGDKMALALT